MAGGGRKRPSGQDTPKISEPPSKRAKQNAEDAMPTDQASTPKRGRGNKIVWVKHPIDHLVTVKDIPWVPEAISHLWKDVKVGRQCFRSC